MHGRKKILKQDVILLDLKIINYVTNVKNVKKIWLKPSFQVLLITYLKLTKKNAKHAWKEKILNQGVILLDLKTINYVTNVKNVKYMVEVSKWINQKVFKRISILQWRP